ncbi:MAG: hypothetical protein OEU89_05805 [Burkholderiaceae bacterium]|nr:hypothetical protein [Burkholderiaceae bacterium]
MERLTALTWQRALWDQLVGWQERLPHAVLLHGGRGIGKRHLAMAFGQLLLCESPGAGRPCGECASCRLLAADNHPDFRWLVPAATCRRGTRRRATRATRHPRRAAGPGRRRAARS